MEHKIKRSQEQHQWKEKIEELTRLNDLDSIPEANMAI